MWSSGRQLSTITVTLSTGLQEVLWNFYMQSYTCKLFHEVTFVYYSALGIQKYVFDLFRSVKGWTFSILTHVIHVGILSTTVLSTYFFKNSQYKHTGCFHLNLKLLLLLLKLCSGQWNYNVYDLIFVFFQEWNIENGLFAGPGGIFYKWGNKQENWILYDNYYAHYQVYVSKTVLFACNQ